MRFGRKKILLGLWIGALIYLMYCLWFTPNFWISVPIVLFPLFAFRLLWIDRFPNVLFFGMMLQWISSATQLLYCNYRQITLTEKFQRSIIPAQMMEEATLLSIIGLYAFTTGLFLAVRKLRLPSIADVINHYNPFRLLVLYIAVSLTIYSLSGIIWNFPSVVQYFNFFFYIKWGFFIITFYVIHKRAAGLRFFFYAFIVFELLISLVSFFAGGIVYFVLFTFISVVLIQPRLNFRTYIFTFIILMGFIQYLILWSAVKKDYRIYVSRGQSVQAVLVSAQEARSKFFDLMMNVSSEKYQEGVEQLVDRLGYIQFFAASLIYVPAKVPHQNGRIYLSAFQHYIIPRFINKDKAILDDSEHTAQYTGIQLSGRKEASSFSLGYIADAYIDFDKVGMHLVIFLVGYLFGFLYSYLVNRSPNVLWIWIFTGPFLILININGTDTKKAMGWILIYFLTVILLRSQLIKRLDPFIRINN